MHSGFADPGARVVDILVAVLARLGFLEAARTDSAVCVNVFLILESYQRSGSGYNHSKGDASHGEEWYLGPIFSTFCARDSRVQVGAGWARQCC